MMTTSNSGSIASQADLLAHHNAVAELRPIQVKDDRVLLIDQRVLPERIDYFDATDLDDMIFAIKAMVVRGAPAIGVAAAIGLAFHAKNLVRTNLPHSDFFDRLRHAKLAIQAARPTAVNLRWATDRTYERAETAAGRNASLEEIASELVSFSVGLIEEDIRVNRAIGDNGASLLTDCSSVLTHCNAGALATCGWGTALGVIRSSFALGHQLTVYVDETRPRQQGAKLTTWELLRDNITPTLITDNMAGYLMFKGKIGAVVTGADRIALNGDSANKIGTYSLAVLARAHKIPFYIAAPLSTIDPEIETGDLIPIEERDEEEVLNINGARVAPEGTRVENPAFDVTPGELITAIITERGVIKPPYVKSIQELFLS